MSPLCRWSATPQYIPLCQKQTGSHQAKLRHGLVSWLQHHKAECGKVSLELREAGAGLQNRFFRYERLVNTGSWQKGGKEEELMKLERKVQRKCGRKISFGARKQSKMNEVGGSLTSIGYFQHLELRVLNLNTLDGDKGIWGKPHLLIKEELNRSRWKFPHNLGQLLTLYHCLNSTNRE